MKIIHTLREGDRDCNISGQKRVQHWACKHRDNTSVLVGTGENDTQAILNLNDFHLIFDRQWMQC